MGGAGLALKSISWLFRGIEFCCAAIILGIFSYFLASLSNHHLHIDTWIRAVEGLSGAAVLYTLFALLLVFCVGGIAIFSALGMFFDLAFLGSFIYLAYALRNGRYSCSGYVNTPLGSGNTNVVSTVSSGSGGFVVLPSLKTACRLQKACFAVALVGLYVLRLLGMPTLTDHSFFFLFSFFIEIALMRQRRREKAFGPSPQNNYTSGTEKRSFWRRKSKRNSKYTDGGLDAQKRGPDSLPEHITPNDIRASYQTDTTAVGQEAPIQAKYGPVPAQQEHRFAQTGHPPHIGQADQAGDTTQPTTHGAYANQQSRVNAQYPDRDNRHGGYLRYGPQGAPYGVGQRAEMAGDETYRTYNPVRGDAH